MSSNEPCARSREIARERANLEHGIAAQVAAGSARKELQRVASSLERLPFRVLGGYGKVDQRGWGRLATSSRLGPLGSSTCFVSTVRGAACRRRCKMKPCGANFRCVIILGDVPPL
ncbi:MAG TPA: hypothetical protein VF976_14915 [Gemmatimonadales bacterium]